MSEHKLSIIASSSESHTAGNTAPPPESTKKEIEKGPAGGEPTNILVDEVQAHFSVSNIRDKSFGSNVKDKNNSEISSAVNDVPTAGLEDHRSSNTGCATPGEITGVAVDNNALPKQDNPTEEVHGTAVPGTEASSTEEPDTETPCTKVITETLPNTSETTHTLPTSPSTDSLPPQSPDSTPPKSPTSTTGQDSSKNTRKFQGKRCRQHKDDSTNSCESSDDSEGEDEGSRPSRPKVRIVQRVKERVRVVKKIVSQNYSSSYYEPFDHEESPHTSRASTESRDSQSCANSKCGLSGAHYEHEEKPELQMMNEREENHLETESNHTSETRSELKPEPQFESEEKYQPADWHKDQPNHTSVDSSDTDSKVLNKTDKFFKFIPKTRSTPSTVTQSPPVQHFEAGNRSAKAQFSQSYKTKTEFSEPFERQSHAKRQPSNFGAHMEAPLNPKGKTRRTIKKAQIPSTEVKAAKALLRVNIGIVAGTYKLPPPEHPFWGVVQIGNSIDWTVSGEHRFLTLSKTARNRYRKKGQCEPVGQCSSTKVSNSIVAAALTVVFFKTLFWALRFVIRFFFK